MEVKEDAFVDPSPSASAATTAPIEQQKKKPSLQKSKAPEAQGGYARCRQAIDAGLDKYQSGDYNGALELFQLALELPGNGFMRMEGSPKEYACASEGEENSCLYNMACCWVKMNKPAAALTCIEALLENNFDEFQTIRTDPDLAPLRGGELDKLLGK